MAIKLEPSLLGGEYIECGFVHLPTLTFLQLHPCLQGLMDCKEYIVINH